MAIYCLKRENGDRLRGVRQLGVPKARQFVRVAGAAANVDIIPFNHEFSTMWKAVVERVFFVKNNVGEFVPPPRPDPGVFFQRLETTRKLLVDLLPSTAPLSHQQFVDQCSTGRKRQIYQQALNQIREGRTDLEKDSRIKCFIKYEKTDHTSKANPVPRVISPRDPKYNIRVGRYLRHVEHRIFKSLGKLFGHPTVIKGMNALDSAAVLREKWDMFADPVAIGLDASRFDQHVSIEALQWEHSIYLECFKQRKHRQRLKKLLEYQLVNRCAGYTPDGIVHYVVNGTRMSGDMNTSLGNCVLMCSMMHAYFRARGIKAQLANNGDDCVVILDRKHMHRFMEGLTEWFLDLGFNMQVEEPVDEFEKVEFCQTKPVFDGQQWIMCRNPVTAIVKDSVMLMPYSRSLFLGWLDSVGVGGLRMTGGLPVFQEFYSSFIRAGKRRNIPVELLPYSFRNWTAGMVREYGEISPIARCSFWAAFDITPDEQIALEQYYAQFRVLPQPGPFKPRPVFT